MENVQKVEQRVVDVAEKMADEATRLAAAASGAMMATQQQALAQVSIAQSLSVFAQLAVALVKMANGREEGEGDDKTD